MGFEDDVLIDIIQTSITEVSHQKGKQIIQITNKIETINTINNITRNKWCEGHTSRKQPGDKVKRRW